jgi:uncharacterized membrane protein YjgN (DUF898 family)
MDAPVAQQPGAALPARPDAHIEAFQFAGRGGEYFRIWIVNLLLTILTLGIYSAWAKVRRLRYFYGATSLAGSSFEYHGQPMQLLKGRMIAASILLPYFLVQYFFPPWDLLFVPLFLIALPFLVVKSRLFATRMTSWRNIRFDFVGSYARAAGVYLGLMLLTILTLGFLFPYWTCARQRFLIGQTRFGETPFDFRARASDYYIAMLLASVIMGGGAFVATIFATPFIGDGAQGADPANLGAAMLLTLPVMILGYLLGFAFMQARITNTAFSSTWIGEHKLDCRLEVLPLFWLYLSNAVAALVSLGLLIPWAQVRLMRYHMERMSLHVVGSLDQFVGAQQSQVAAAGEELSDLLDVDLGL